MSERLVIGFLLVGVRHDFWNKGSQARGCSSAERVNCVLFFYVSDQFEAIIAAQFIVYVQARQVPAQEHVDKQVTQRNEVVSSTCRKEIELVLTGENQVSSENVELGFRQVLVCFFVLKTALEPIVNQINRAVFETILIGVLCRYSFVEIHQKVVKFEVIVYVPGRMHHFQNV